MYKSRSNFSFFLLVFLCHCVLGFCALVANDNSIPNVYIGLAFLLWLTYLSSLRQWIWAKRIELHTFVWNSIHWKCKFFSLRSLYFWESNECLVWAGFTVCQMYDCLWWDKNFSEVSLRTLLVIIFWSLL